MLYELKRIKQMRLQLGLTQIQLAKLANVSQSLIAKVERERIEPSYSIAKKIFTVLEEQLAKKQKTIFARDVLTKNIISIKSDDTIDKAIDLMKKHAISQMPVVKNNLLIGSISEETFIKNYDKIKSKKMKIQNIMDEPFPMIPEDTNALLIKEMLKTYPAIITTKQGEPTGIICKVDLLKKL